MMRRVFGLLVFGLATHAVNATAAPITVGGSQTWLYSGASAGCSTCSATVIFELLTQSSLKVSFENTSFDGVAGQKILTGVGFNTDPNLVSVSLLSQSIEGGKTWKFGTGVGGGTWEIGLVTKQGINNGLDNQSAAFNSGYVILGWSSPLIGLNGLTIDNSVTKFQAAGPNDLSLQAPGVPVPEPGTLLLLSCGFGWLVHQRRRLSV